MTVDTHRQMTELGSTPVPDPDPVFATQLELKLRAARVGATAPEIVRPRRWPATIAALTFTVAVLVFGLATLRAGPSTFQISTASRTEVRLPNGEVIEATPGLDLPQGSRVEVGPQGSANIGGSADTGDVYLGPSEVAEITPEGVVGLPPSVRSPSNAPLASSPVTNPRRDVDETAPPLTSPVEQIVSTTNPPVTVDSTRADATTTTGRISDTAAPTALVPTLTTPVTGDYITTSTSRIPSTSTTDDDDLATTTTSDPQALASTTLVGSENSASTTSIADPE